MPERRRRTKRERGERRPRERERTRVSEGAGDGEDLLTQLRTLISGAGGGARAAASVNEAVMADNARYRQRHREDLEYIAELEEDLEALPEEGAIVIPKALAEQLKITKPEDVQKIAADLAEVRGKLTTAELASVFEDAAKVLGWNSTVLRNLPGMADVRIELRDEQQTIDGEKRTVRVPYAVPKKEGAAAERLEDFAKARTDWQPFMPALTASAGDDDDAEGDTSRERSTTTTGTPYPRQSERRSDPPKKSAEKVVDRTVQRFTDRARGGNALRPAPAPASTTTK